MHKTISNAVTVGIAILLVLFQIVPVLAGGAVERKEGEKPFSSSIIPYAPSSFCDSVSEIPILECEALEALYNSTDGDNWSNNTDWLVTDTPCSTPWYGVTCDGGQVIELDLGHNQLNGIIPSELGDLSSLLYLYLDDNQLSEGIPPELGNLSSLLRLILGRNQLSGGIPPELGKLSNVAWLNLDKNQLSGDIPPELGNMSKLWILYLSNNQLSGSIPPELGNLSGLMDLTMYGNQLSGSIPPELGNLSNLHFLYLSSNQLSGSIPPELGNLFTLGYFSLSTNQLSGSIPIELWNLSNLTYLDLSNNQLSGSIPPEIGYLSGLQYLWLDNNQLSGIIPPEIGNLADLGFLYLDNNQLSGDIPASLANLINLGREYNDLGYNMLTASDPSLIAFLNFKDPDWAETQTVPPTDLQVTDVYTTSVVLAWTPISYSVDGGYYEVSYAPTLGGPYTVHGSTADKTASGYVVGGLYPDKDYYFVVRAYTPAHDDQQNDLLSIYTEEISATTIGWDFCKDVSEIPALECEAMFALYTSTDGNNWTDNTGWLVTNTPCSTPWYGVTCSRGQVIELDLDLNQLNGNIPPEVGNLSSMRELCLSSNQLSGVIPSELGYLSSMKSLYLHSNQLSGSIPIEIGNLSVLEILWLFNNQLSGNIPASLTNLANLGSSGESNIGYNMLTASDPSLITFLDEKDPDWEETQTVPPTDLQVADVYTPGIVLAWTPISYTLDGGYYEISYATTSGGPYTVHGTTADKTASSYTFDSLSADIDYYFVLRTFTPAHIYQQNDLWSAYSQEAFTHNYQLFLPIVVRQQ